MSNLTYVSPCFIVASLKNSVSYYTDKLGFQILYTGPEDNPFFAIVVRDKIFIQLKEIAPDIMPIPNHTRHPYARLDAFIYTSDPDVIYEEYRAKGLNFKQPIMDDDDNLRGFEITDADGYVLFFGRPINDQ
jgi:hypothetical protein